MFDEGGRVTGAGRGGAFFASTRMELVPPLVLGRPSRDGNPPRVVEPRGSLLSMSIDLPNESLELEIDLANDGNVGLGMRGDAADVEVDRPDLGSWLGLGRLGVRGAGMADRRGSDMSKSDHIGNGNALSSSEDDGRGGGGPGRRPRGNPLDMGKFPSIGGLEKGLLGNFSVCLGVGSLLV